MPWAQEYTAAARHRVCRRDVDAAHRARQAIWRGLFRLRSGIHSAMSTDHGERAHHGAAGPSDRDTRGEGSVAPGSQAGRIVEGRVLDAGNCKFLVSAYGEFRIGAATPSVFVEAWTSGGTVCGNAAIGRLAVHLRARFTSPFAPLIRSRSSGSLLPLARSAHTRKPGGDRSHQLHFDSAENGGRLF